MSGILVAGGTGTLGRALIRQLRREGRQIISVSRDPGRALALAAPDLLSFACDLSSQPLPPDLLAGVHTIYNCTGIASPSASKRAIYRANVLATARLLDQAKEAGVRRFIHASCASLYVDGSTRLNLSETAPLAQQFYGACAASKAEAETRVLLADMPGRMRTISLRLALLSDPCPAWLIAALRKGALPLIDDGEALIERTLTDDAARAMILAARASETAGGQAINITSGAPVSLASLVRDAQKMGQTRGASADLPPPASPRPVSFRRAMAKAMALELGHVLRPGSSGPLLTRARVAILGRSLTLDINAARELLGYSPDLSLNARARS